MPRKLVKLTETGHRELTEEEREERNRYYDKMRLRVLRGTENRSLKDIMNEYDDENEICPLSLYKDLFGEEDYEENQIYEPGENKHKLAKEKIEPYLKSSSYLIYENEDEEENKVDLVDLLINGVVDIVKKWRFIGEYFLLGKRKREEDVI